MIELRLESGQPPESRFDFLLVARHDFFDPFQVLRDTVGVAQGIGGSIGGAILNAPRCRLVLTPTQHQRTVPNIFSSKQVNQQPR